MQNTTTIDLVQLSSIFTWKLQKEVAQILQGMNLEHLEGFFDSETHKHTERVSSFAVLIAYYLNLKEEDINYIQDIAPFHDFGKILIPANILAKPGKLTNEEFDVIKGHPTTGYELLKDRGNKTLDLAAVVAWEHHEKYNGGGYPRGISGNEIHLYSRIIAVADVLDSLLTIRVYKPAWAKEDVYKLFEEQSGKQFDPKIVDILLKNFEEFYELHMWCQNEIKELSEDLKQKIAPIFSCFVSKDFSIK